MCERHLLTTSRPHDPGCPLYLFAIHLIVLCVELSLRSDVHYSVLYSEVTGSALFMSLFVSLVPTDNLVCCRMSSAALVW